MKFIEPTTPTLLSTSVAADPAPEWAAGTKYNNADEVQHNSKKYISRANGNLGRVPADNLIIKTVKTSSSTSLSISGVTKLLTVEPGLQIYNGMKITLSRGTSREYHSMSGEVVSYNSGTGEVDARVYQSTGDITSSNWLVTVEDYTQVWEEIGATNQYACLDAYVNTQTTDDETITMRLAVERVDHVALFMLAGASVTLTLYDETETTILSQQTISLLYEASFITEIFDWYEYFFGEYDYIDTCDASLGVLAASAVLKIEITPNDSGVAAVGQIVVGRLQDGGTTISAPSAAIQDYSYRETDEEGRTNVKEGYWAKLNSVSCAVENIRFDWLYRKLAKLRATPTAWLAADDLGDWEALTVYGYYRDLEMEARTIDYSYYTLEIEGLI
jgi:hypothetical protein